MLSWQGVVMFSILLVLPILHHVTTAYKACTTYSIPNSREEGEACCTICIWSSINAWAFFGVRPRGSIVNLSENSSLKYITKSCRNMPGEIRAYEFNKLWNSYVSRPSINWREILNVQLVWGFKVSGDLQMSSDIKHTNSYLVKSKYF